MQKIEPLVSVVILTHNRADLLKDCLKGVLKSTYKHLEVIVVDNASQEEIAGFVKKEFPKAKVQVKRSKVNDGLTGGFNFGFKFCTGKYILILSNDTKLERKAIDYMVKMAEADPTIGIVAPKVIQMRDPNHLHNVGSFLTYSGLLYHYGILQDKDNPKYQKPYYTFSANGSGFLIRTEALQAAGPFDKDFIICYDDSDISHRVWLAGYSVVYCPQAENLHLWSATIKSGTNQFWQYNHRNHMISFIKCLSGSYLILMLSLFQLSLWLWFFYNLLKLRFDLLSAVPQSYLYLLNNWRAIMKKRKIVQEKVRKVRDAEIFTKTLVSPDLSYYLIHFYILDFKDIKLPPRVLYYSP